MSKAPQFAHYERMDSKLLKKCHQSETEVAVVKHADMSERMQQHAVDCCRHAFEQQRVLDDIAEIIKTEFDIMYQPTWHCVVGRGLGSYVTHQQKCFIFFYWGEVGILLWRTECPPRDQSYSVQEDDEGVYEHQNDDQEQY